MITFSLPLSHLSYHPGLQVQLQVPSSQMLRSSMNGHSAKEKITEIHGLSCICLNYYFNLHVPTIVFSSETKVAKSKNVNKKSLYIGNEK